MPPIILHLDMNSYFASCEQQDNPAYRGRPLGVCEHLGGIIIGASIEAKKWGITTGTPVWEAKKLYPKIILSHTHAERYRFYTRRFIKVVSDYTDKVEKYSIDEVFLDITKQCNIRKPGNRPPKAGPPTAEIIGKSDWNLVDPFAEGVNIAREIKRRMKTEVGDYLTCSIGIAENKMLAKIGSDLKKPDGIVVIQNEECRVPNGRPANSSLPTHHSAFCDYPIKPLLKEVLYLTKTDLYQKLKLTDIPGIGRRQEKNLNELGIKTLLDLKNYPKSHFIRRFGIVQGNHLYNMGQLESNWKSAVEDDQTIKSIGHMYTLPQEFRQPQFFVPVLYKLCEMVGRRMRRKNLEGNGLSFYFHDKDYKGFGQSRGLGFYLQDGREIFLQAMDIYKKFTGREGSGLFAPEQYKLIGVTVFGIRERVNQLSLFGLEEKNRKLVNVLDKINNKYGEFTVFPAPVLKAGKVFRDSVGFGRMKELEFYN